MNFHDIRFPTDISFGSSGGPERRTEIVTLTNGFEERNSPWAHSRRRYDAGLGLRTLDDLASVIAFFEARMGQLYGFRWKDWADYKSSVPSADITDADQALGLGDDVTTDFPLTKLYASGAQSYARPIAKPVDGSVVVAVDGVAQVAGSDFTVDTAIGHVQFTTAPSSGAAITAGFEFDVPVRFDTDAIQANINTFQAGSIPQVPVIEVRV